MYCRNCGVLIKDNVEICIFCGVKPLSERKYCQECGVSTQPNQELCIKCGCRLKTESIEINTDFSTLPLYYKEEFTKILDSNEDYKGKWNWCAFFFSWIWALTKGLWVFALISLAVGLITYDMIGIGSIICAIILGVRGNYMYYNLRTKKKILSI
jgi:hypothetical protein